jgi:hypothetical protein
MEVHGRNFVMQLRAQKIAHLRFTFRIEAGDIRFLNIASISRRNAPIQFAHQFQPLYKQLFAQRFHHRSFRRLRILAEIFEMPAIARIWDAK